MGRHPYLLCARCACSGRPSASSCAGCVDSSAGRGTLGCTPLLLGAGNTWNWTYFPQPQEKPESDKLLQEKNSAVKASQGWSVFGSKMVFPDYLILIVCLLVVCLLSAPCSWERRGRDVWATVPTVLLYCLPVCCLSVHLPFPFPPSLLSPLLHWNCD